MKNVKKFESNPVIHFHIRSTLYTLKLKIEVKNSMSTPVENWVNCQFGQISPNFEQLLNFQSMCSYILWPLWSEICLFGSIYYRFQDKNFFRKNGKIANLPISQNLKNFRRFVALTYYDPCDHILSSISLYLLLFRD